MEATAGGAGGGRGGARTAVLEGVAPKELREQRIVQKVLGLRGGGGRGRAQTLEDGRPHADAVTGPETSSTAPRAGESWGGEENWWASW